MHARRSVALVVLVALVGVSACGNPGSPPSEGAPTAEPTTVVAAPVASASASAAVEPAASASGAGAATQPIVVKGSGTWTDYGSDGAACTAPATVTLTVKADTSAEMAVLGPMFVSHVPCTQSDPASTVQYLLAGTASGESVTFASCNSGGFDATGSVTYAGGSLAGQASCISKSGSAAGKPAFGVSIP